MLKINTIEIAGFGSALQALRLPFGKQCRSKCWHELVQGYYNPMQMEITGEVCMEQSDLDLMRTLVKRGNEHAKVLRGIVVYAEIEAPIWFYRELETYRIGRERLSSESTMHIECQGLSGKELEDAKDKIPSGHIQKTIDMYSYQCLRTIYFQRKDHRLPMWHDFCKWLESLPFSAELITCTNDNKENSTSTSLSK